MARLLKCDVCGNIVEDDKRMVRVDVRCQAFEDQTGWVEIDLCADCRPDDLHEFIMGPLKREWLVRNDL